MKSKKEIQLMIYRKLEFNFVNTQLGVNKIFVIIII